MSETTLRITISVQMIMNWYCDCITMGLGCVLKEIQIRLANVVPIAESAFQFINNHLYNLSMYLLPYCFFLLFIFLQIGQPLPAFLFAIIACHSCPWLHFHHTFLLLLGITSAGVNLLFFS